MLTPIDVTSVDQPRSKLLLELGSIVAATKFTDDPYYKKLKKTADLDLASSQKLAKFEEKESTPALAELKALLGNAEHLHDSFGSWASDRFIKSCVSNWHQKTSDQNEYHESIGYLTDRFVDSTLARLHDIPHVNIPRHNVSIASKATSLIHYLRSQYHRGIAIIIFVERRSAAFALCELLRSCPELSHYRIFSFVGLASGRRTSLIETADIRVQKKAFADFRSGSQDICIATSVVEEGVDIQAVNIVIRYDDPKQFVAFVQSRGRARRQQSRFVYFRTTCGKPGKYSEWERLEAELQDKYKNEMRILHTYLEAEDQEEVGDDEYVIPSTGALLDYHNSKTHLQHFCATLSIPTNPIYILDGEVGIGIGAKVVLPSSLPSQFQYIHGTRRNWLTQKMAERDAAFEACKALHVAGLVDDHFMPIRPEKPVLQKKHGLRQYDVDGEAHIWNESNLHSLYAHRVVVTCGQDQQYSTLIMVLPKLLPHDLDFCLSENTSRNLNVIVHPIGQWCGNFQQAKETTKALFAVVFHTGSAFESLDAEDSIPLLLLPDEGQIEDWKHSSLDNFLSRHTVLTDRQPLLIWHKKRLRPYLWAPPHNLYASATLAAVPIKKLQIYTGLRNTTERASQSLKDLPTEDCFTKENGTIYGPTVLLVPSILHIASAALRADIARQTLLSSIGFRSSSNLTIALLAKSAAGVLNFERLEFLGDVLLKYYTVLQLFGDHAEVTEGVLTEKALDILSNNRLETAVQQIGLHTYLTTEAPVQAHWKVPRRPNAEPPPRRKLLSKTLADCAESTLGAAFLDGKDINEADINCISFLRLLLPEVTWCTPADWVRKLTSSTGNRQGTVLQARIKDILGYSFRNPSLLSEALTHSSLIPGQQSLERLEFLGDAIIDRIIKIALFDHSELDAGRMTIFRHALVSHHWLAYCALSTQCTLPINDIITYRNGQTKKIETNKTINLTDLIFFSEATPREHVSDARTRHTALQPQIETELNTFFPWTSLRATNVPKVCSDIVESLIAGIYLDSSGSLDTCTNVLHRLGVTRLIDCMTARADGKYEVLTPEENLRILCAAKQIDVKITSDGDGGRHFGRIYLDGNEFVHVEAACREEARSRAAEKALEGLATWQASSQ